MIIVKANNSIINLEQCQGIELSKNYIVFHLPENQAFNEEYASDALAKDAFDKLFLELAETPGVEGAVLTGNFV